MRLGFVCTNYNNAAFTRGFVDSLTGAAEGGGISVVIVDNGSAPDDVAALQDIAGGRAWVELLLSERNLGYFPGLNAGICRLRRGVPEIHHVVVGNNDLVFPADFAVAVDRHRSVFDQWAVVAPDLVTPAGVHQNPHVSRPIGRLRRLVWEVYYSSYAASVLVGTMARATRRVTARPENQPGQELYAQAGPIEQGYGACYLLGPLFFERFNRLFAPTFLLQEEFFLTEQLRSVGQLTYYEPGIVVQHRGHATMGRVPSRPRWQMGRDAHVVYRRFVRMSGAEQREAIAAFATAPFDDECLGGTPSAASGA